VVKLVNTVNSRAFISIRMVKDGIVEVLPFRLE